MKYVLPYSYPLTCHLVTYVLPIPRLRAQQELVSKWDENVSDTNLTKILICISPREYKYFALLSLYLLIADHGYITKERENDISHALVFYLV